MANKSALLIQNAAAIVTAHDAKIFCCYLSSSFLKLGLNDAAAAAFSCKPWWEDSKVLAIECRDRAAAKILRGQWRQIAQIALQEGLEKVLLAWPNCKRPYPIPSAMAEENQGCPPLRSDKPEIDALRIGEMMLTSEQPMSLVDMDTDDQVWTNRALASLIGATIEESRRLNMRDLWIRNGNDDGLDYVKQTLQQQSRLVHRYETQLNQATRAQFESKFELVLNGRYRLTTIFEAVPLVRV
jgi:hypothetical protein